ncbi:hypothetical protein ABZW10_13360 [Kitasatospora sp. NPDC004723]|uniref:hypothetical protein n=1 Tax=Kitasatospora sp. NPDC004723 TaxID=3154288 RepID=UPI0033B61E5D
MRRGCLRTERDGSGLIGRRRVTSQAFKGQGTPMGVETTWVVAESVARAIAVAERLQPPQEDLLFAPLPTGTQFARARSHEALSNRETNDHIGRLIDWVNEYCKQHGRGDGIPLVNGQRWKLTTRQFRRTLAWFIARRPGGAIAGAIQYRHHSIQMFEGYAGTSQSGFRAEVEGERALARGEHLAMKVERHEHTQLTGPSAQEAADRLEEFGSQLRSRGIVPDNQAQFRRLIARHDPHVYPGEFVTCVWRPDRALCRHEAAQAEGPDLPECKPLDCRNVALDAENAARWREFFARLDAALADGATLAPYVRARLQQRRDAVARFLDKHQLEESA